MKNSEMMSLSNARLCEDPLKISKCPSASSTAGTDHQKPRIVLAGQADFTAAERLLHLQLKFRNACSFLKKVAVVRSVNCSNVLIFLHRTS